MAYLVREFGSITALEHFMNGGVFGGRYNHSIKNGDQLIFTSPAVTVTFTGPTPNYVLTLSDIRQQLLAANSHLILKNIDRNIAIGYDDGSTAIQLPVAGVGDRNARKALGLGLQENNGMIVSDRRTNHPYLYRVSYNAASGSHVIYVWL